MGKKKTSRQTIIIVVLCILLLLSLTFGSTYSYFNGSSKLPVGGKVTTATLAIGLGESSEFKLHTNSDKVIPGQPLTNTQLDLENKSGYTIYTIVRCSLTVEQNTEGEEKEMPTASQLASMEILETMEEVIGSGWRLYCYTCKDTVSKIYSFVYLGNKNLTDGTVTNGNGYGKFPANSIATVIDSDSLIVPRSWQNEMQNKIISISFTAYAIQADYVRDTNPDVISTDLATRERAIAELLINEFHLDQTIAP